MARSAIWSMLTNKLGLARLEGRVG